MKIEKSVSAFEKAQKIIPGGVNSPVRSFKSVGGGPLFIKKGKGAHILDIDGNKYIDFCMSWGASILGHAHKVVIRKVRKAIKNGSSFGCPTLHETKLASIITGAYPSMQMVRFVSSGTEAAMSAIRLARGYTGRNIIIKFDGCYHGHSDNLLVAAGSGVAELSYSSSKGVPPGSVAKTVSIPFNDTEIFEKTVHSHKNEIACVILEPVPANMGLILPKPGFLERIREVTAQNNIVLIFDEVITGFRLAYGGAQEIYKIKPDLTCLGKIIGGGFPVGAFGGKKEIMEQLSPIGDVYQAGTLSGNPLAMQAGIAVLSYLKKKNVYKNLEQKMKFFKEQLNDKVKIRSIGSIFWIYYNNSDKIDNQSHVNKCDFRKFSLFYKNVLELNVYLSPSQYEVNFLSFSHSKNNIKKTASGINTFY